MNKTLVTRERQNNAIRHFRVTHPNSGQRTVARKLFDNARLYQLGRRTFYSIYNIVRRHDAVEAAKAAIPTSSGEFTGC